MEKSNYKWGIIYFNPDDPHFIVPKRNPWMGWTFNFASPYAYILLLGIILIAAASGIFFN
jgi:uncharacterized membrane protein